MSAPQNTAHENRLAQATLSDLEEKTRLEVSEELGVDWDSRLANIPFSSYDPDLQAGLSSILGRRLISNIYRQLLLVQLIYFIEFTIVPEIHRGVQIGR